MLLGNTQRCIGFILHAASLNSSKLQASQLRSGIRKAETVCFGVKEKPFYASIGIATVAFNLLLQNVLLADDNINLLAIESINARKRLCSWQPETSKILRKIIAPKPQAAVRKPVVQRQGEACDV
jgi:hypothetical protein